MIVVGLTGSIGMGKSTVAEMFLAHGIPVFDADAVVHALQASGGPLAAAIEAEFAGTTGPSGVDRAKLGARVFGNPARMKALEAIIHPAVARAQGAFLGVHRDAPLVVFDIPLLLEKGRQTLVDTVVVVSAPKDIQRARVLARPNMTVEKFEHILALQMPDADKRTHADHVIDTDVPLAVTRAQVGKLIACLTAK